MVTALYYLKRFFHVFPQRYKQINNLRAEKCKIDQKILKVNFLSDMEVENLISIMGKDLLFRRAEKRKQLTLRHITWKLLKSIENYDVVRNKLPILEPNEGFREKALKFRSILDYALPRIKYYLLELDNIYLEQYSVLIKRDFDSYIKLIHVEQEINRQINAELQPLRDNMVSLLNILSLYDKYLHKRGIMEEADIIMVFGVVSIGLIFINLIFFPEEKRLDPGRADFLLKCAGIGAGLAGVLYHAVIKLPEFYKLVKENLI